MVVNKGSVTNKQDLIDELLSWERCKDLTKRNVSSKLKFAKQLDIPAKRGLSAGKLEYELVVSNKPKKLKKKKKNFQTQRPYSFMNKTKQMILNNEEVKAVNFEEFYFEDETPIQKSKQIKGSCSLKIDKKNALKFIDLTFGDLKLSP